jgi:hypothetical protein
MLLLEGYKFQILRALGMYYFFYVEFSDFYVNQSLAGQTIGSIRLTFCRISSTNCSFGRYKKIDVGLTHEVSTCRYVWIFFNKWDSARANSFGRMM